MIPYMSEHNSLLAKPDFSPGSPDDLNEIVAVILTVPSGLVGVGGDYSSTAFENLTIQFRSDLKEILPPWGPSDFPEPAGPRPYQIGPAAGGTYYFFITLLQYGDHFLHSSADYLAWGAFALAAGRRWRERIRQMRPQYGLTERDALIYPRCILEAICLKDAHARYGITPRATVRAHSRDSYYTDGRRPTGQSIHTIAIRSGGRTYIYVVDGRAKVIEHMMLDGVKVIPLALPDWFPAPE